MEKQDHGLSLLVVFVKETPCLHFSSYLLWILSKMMIKACQSHLLHQVRLNPNGIGISHLFFAYDSLFFLQATLQNCEHSSDLLHSYCSASGQLINVDKSNLYFSPNTPCQIINLLNSILQMRVVSDLGKYLVYPQFGGDLKVLL